MTNFFQNNFFYEFIETEIFLNNKKGTVLPHKLLIQN